MVCGESPAGLPQRRNAAETCRIIALPRVIFGADVAAEWSRFGKQAGLTTSPQDSSEGVAQTFSRKARGG